MIRTDRLVLRRWKPEDLSEYSQICGDPKVMRWIADCSLKTRKQTEDEIAKFEQHWAEHEFGLFAVELLASARLTGFVGPSIPRFLPEILFAVEIGFRLARDLWGRGLATEGSRAVMDFGFKQIGLDRIVSICHVRNTPSRRIMEKLGMRLERETVVPGTGNPVQVCAIERPDWS